jgi:pSer/pThr/pTyr-binding forkhead associated (FHA) protein
MPGFYIGLACCLLVGAAIALYVMLRKRKAMCTSSQPPASATRNKTTSLLPPPRSMSGIVPPFAYEDESPWAWLEYKSGNFLGQRLALKRTIATIGRDEECDIWLDDEMASWKHAELAWTPEQAYLTDCESLNGTMRNKHKVRGTTMINSNDIITIGTHSFLFITEAQKIEPVEDDPLTRHTWRSAQDLMTPSAKQEIVTQDPNTPRPSMLNTDGELQIDDGEMAGRTIVLNQPLLTVGRDTNCHILLVDASISRQHAQFLSQIDGDYVQDLASRNGTTVNGEALSAPRRLQTGDIVGIGNIHMTYTATPRTPLPQPRIDISPSRPGMLHSGPVPLRLPSRQK